MGSNGRWMLAVGVAGACLVWGACGDGGRERGPKLDVDTHIAALSSADAAARKGAAEALGKQPVSMEDTKKALAAVNAALKKERKKEIKAVLKTTAGKLQRTIAMFGS